MPQLLFFGLSGLQLAKSMHLRSLLAETAILQFKIFCLGLCMPFLGCDRLWSTGVQLPKMSDTPDSSRPSECQNISNDYNETRLLASVGTKKTDTYIRTYVLTCLLYFTLLNLLYLLTLLTYIQNCINTYHTIQYSTLRYSRVEHRTIQYIDMT